MLRNGLASLLQSLGHTILFEADNGKQFIEKLNPNKLPDVVLLDINMPEMTYKEIADKMFVSPRTIDGYRDALFEKLQVKTRVGLVMYAIKNGIVNV